MCTKNTNFAYQPHDLIICEPEEKGVQLPLRHFPRIISIYRIVPIPQNTSICSYQGFLHGANQYSTGLYIYISMIWIDNTVVMDNWPCEKSFFSTELRQIYKFKSFFHIHATTDLEHSSATKSCHMILCPAPVTLACFLVQVPP